VKTLKLERELLSDGLFGCTAQCSSHSRRPLTKSESILRLKMKNDASRFHRDANRGPGESASREPKADVYSVVDPKFLGAKSDAGVISLSCAVAKQLSVQCVDKRGGCSKSNEDLLRNIIAGSRR
jgi:hypothetical protein